MKKLLIIAVCGIIARTALAFPCCPPPPHCGWGCGPGYYYHRPEYNGVMLASDIVGIVANGLYIANQLNPKPVVVQQVPVVVPAQQPQQVIIQTQPPSSNNNLSTTKKKHTTTIIHPDGTKETTITYE